MLLAESRKAESERHAGQIPRQRCLAVIYTNLDRTHTVTPTHQPRQTTQTQTLHYTHPDKNKRKHINTVSHVTVVHTHIKYTVVEESRNMLPLHLMTVSLSDYSPPSKHPPCCFTEEATEVKRDRIITELCLQMIAQGPFLKETGK